MPVFKFVGTQNFYGNSNLWVWVLRNVWVSKICGPSTHVCGYSKWELKILGVNFFIGS